MVRERLKVKMLLNIKSVNLYMWKDGTDELTSSTETEMQT